MKIIVTLFAVFVILINSDLYAQNSFFDNFYVGSSINYNTRHFDSEHDYFNDSYSYAFGYNFHFIASKNLNPALSVNTGIELFSFRYTHDDLHTPEGLSDGTITNNEYVLSMTSNPSVFYLGLPVIFSYKFSDNVPIRIHTGPKFYFKVGHINGETQFVYIDNEAGESTVVNESAYQVPEDANSLKVAGVLGISYDLPLDIPLSMELSIQHSITPYVSGNNYISSWSRGLIFSVFYTL